MTELSSAIFEELIEDTKILTKSLIQYGDRWTTYGKQLGNTASESQKQEIAKVLNDFSTEVVSMGAIFYE